ncbi:MAG: Uma2 family endonuclease [Hyphomicrobiaceae bacterium]|nr:Uma2 family endonuclease [Hyphomicrobiaceae bacterium]
MSAIDKKRMTVDEFLLWACEQPGRYELIDGIPVAMSPERVRHTKIKGTTYLALTGAIKRSDSGCSVLTDGATVRINDHVSYEPDALVYCGDDPSDDDLEVLEPVIIVEVLSPSTRHVDTGSKFIGYFNVSSVQHYLIIDTEQKIVIHHARDKEGQITSASRGEGTLNLDPPGLEVKVRAFFEDIE